MKPTAGWSSLNYSHNDRRSRDRQRIDAQINKLTQRGIAKPTGGVAGAGGSGGNADGSLQGRASDGTGLPERREQAALKNRVASKIAQSAASRSKLSGYVQGSAPGHESGGVAEHIGRSLGYSKNNRPNSGKKNAISEFLNKPPAKDASGNKIPFKLRFNDAPLVQKPEEPSLLFDTLIQEAEAAPAQIIPGEQPKNPQEEVFDILNRYGLQRYSRVIIEEHGLDEPGLLIEMDQESVRELKLPEAASSLFYKCCVELKKNWEQKAAARLAALDLPTASAFDDGEFADVDFTDTEITKDDTMRKEHDGSREAVGSTTIGSNTSPSKPSIDEDLTSLKHESELDSEAPIEDIDGTSVGVATSETGVGDDDVFEELKPQQRITLNKKRASLKYRKKSPSKALMDTIVEEETEDGNGEGNDLNATQKIAAAPDGRTVLSRPGSATVVRLPPQWTKLGDGSSKAAPSESATSIEPPLAKDGDEHVGTTAGEPALSSTVLKEPAATGNEIEALQYDEKALGIAELETLPSPLRTKTSIGVDSSNLYGGLSGVLTGAGADEEIVDDDTDNDRADERSIGCGTRITPQMVESGTSPDADGPTQTGGAKGTPGFQDAATAEDGEGRGTVKAKDLVFIKSRYCCHHCYMQFFYTPGQEPLNKTSSGNIYCSPECMEEARHIEGAEKRERIAQNKEPEEETEFVVEPAVQSLGKTKDLAPTFVVEQLPKSVAVPNSNDGSKSSSSTAANPIVFTTPEAQALLDRQNGSANPPRSGVASVKIETSKTQDENTVPAYNEVKNPLEEIGKLGVNPELEEKTKELEEKKRKLVWLELQEVLEDITGHGSLYAMT